MKFDVACRGVGLGFLVLGFRSSQLCSLLFPAAVVRWRVQVGMFGVCVLVRGAWWVVLCLCVASELRGGWCCWGVCALALYFVIVGRRMSSLRGRNMSIASCPHEVRAP